MKGSFTMHIVMLCALLVSGPLPYILDVYESNAKCAQAKYDFSRGMSPQEKRTTKYKLVCVPRPQYKPIP